MKQNILVSSTNGGV